MANQYVLLEDFTTGTDPDGWTFNYPASQPAGVFTHDYVADIPSTNPVASGYALEVSQVAAATTTDPATMASPMLDFTIGEQGGYLRFWARNLAPASIPGPCHVALIDSSGTQIVGQDIYDTSGYTGGWQQFSLYIPPGTYSAQFVSSLGTAVAVGAAYTTEISIGVFHVELLNKVPDTPTPVTAGMLDLDPDAISSSVPADSFNPRWSPVNLVHIGADDFVTDQMPQIISVDDAAGVTSRRVFAQDGRVVDLLAPVLSPGTPAQSAAGADNFADAPDILLGQSSAPTDNTTFTTETGEPDASGYADPLAQTAWWKFTPDTDMVVSFDLDQTVDLGMGTDTVLGVYTGTSVDALTVVGYDDDSGAGQNTSKYSLSATAGVTYYIQARPYSAGDNMQFVLRALPDSGTPVNYSSDALTHIDSDRVAYVGWGSTPVIAAISENGPVITRQGDINNGQSTSMTPSGGAPGDWDVDQNDGVLAMVSPTKGYVVGWSATSGAYQSYLLPFTMTDEAEFAPGTALFADAAIQLKASAADMIAGGIFFWDANTVVVLQREETNPNNGYIDNLPRMAAFDLSGNLIAQSGLLVPSAFTPNRQYGWASATFDKTTGDFVVATEEVTDYNYSAGHEQGPDSTVNIFRVSFDGTAFTIGPKTEVVSSTNTQRSYPVTVEVLADGRVFLDYVEALSNQVTSAGGVIYVRHVQIRDINFNVLSQWDIGADPDPALWNYYAIQRNERSVVTDHFAVIYYDYWNDYLSATDQRYLLIRHTENTVPITVGAHHGTGTIKYTAGAPDTLTDSSQSILQPGTVTMLQNGTGQGAVVGTGDVLADADDTTYVTLGGVARDMVEVQLAPLNIVDPGAVTAVELHLRAATSDAVGGVASIDVDLSTDSGGTGFAGEFGSTETIDEVQIPRDGVVHDLVIPLSPEADNGIPLSQTASALLAGAFMQAYTTADAAATWTVNLYEVSLLVTYDVVTTLPNRLTIKGPASPGQGDSDKHRGAFAIDQTHKSISAWLQVGIPAKTIYVQAYARYFVDDGSPELIEQGSDPLGPSMMVPPSTFWTEQFLYNDARDDATHWLLDVKMYSDAAMTQPLEAGTEVYFDCFMVPDNGLDMRALKQPYLDGDQPGAIWEGEERNSTSIYGEKIISPFRKVFLGDALAIPAPPPPPEEPTP